MLITKTFTERGFAACRLPGFAASAGEGLIANEAPAIEAIIAP
jgi:hypothetical protein